MTTVHSSAVRHLQRRSSFGFERVCHERSWRHSAEISQHHVGRNGEVMCWRVSSPHAASARCRFRWPKLVTDSVSVPTHGRIADESVLLTLGAKQKFGELAMYAMPVRI